MGDVAGANLLVLEDERADYQAFNVGGNRQVTVLEYAELLIGKAGNGLQPEVAGKYRFGDTRHIFSDVSKLRALGWEPATPLSQIADEYLAWASSQPDLYDHTRAALSVMEQVGTVRCAQA